MHEENPPWYFTVCWYAVCLPGRSLLHVTLGAGTLHAGDCFARLGLAVASVNISRGLCLWDPKCAGRLTRQQAIAFLRETELSEKGYPEFRRFMDRLLAKLSCVTRTATRAGLRETLLSDFMQGGRLWAMERHSLKRGREQISKYRRIGGLNVKHIIEIAEDGRNCEEKCFVSGIWWRCSSQLAEELPFCLHGVPQTRKPMVAVRVLHGHFET